MKTNEQEIKEEIYKLVGSTATNKIKTDQLYSLFQSQLESRIEEIIGEDEPYLVLNQYSEGRNRLRKEQRAKLAHLKSAGREE